MNERFSVRIFRANNDVQNIVESVEMLQLIIALGQRLTVVITWGNITQYTLDNGTARQLSMRLL